MLIYVKYGARKSLTLTRNEPAAIATVMRDIRRCAKAPSYLWWALPADARQAETLEKLMEKSRALLPLLRPLPAASAQHRVTHLFPCYGAVEGRGVSLSESDDAQRDDALFENTLRKLANILTWVEFYGQDTVLSDRAFKRETFEKVAFKLEPLVAGRAPRILCFPPEPDPTPVPVPASSTVEPAPADPDNHPEVTGQPLTPTQLRRRTQRAADFAGAYGGDLPASEGILARALAQCAAQAEVDSASYRAQQESAARLTDEPPTEGEQATMGEQANDALDAVRLAVASLEVTTPLLTSAWPVVVLSGASAEPVEERGSAFVPREGEDE